MRVLRLAAITFALVILAACTRAPRLATPESRDEIRNEYLAANPDGKYNHKIMKGEIAKGMTMIEVLASWGLPSVRSSRQTSTAELWAYYSRDEHSGNIVGYTLAFDERVLTSWLIDPDVTDLGTLTPKELLLPQEGVSYDTAPAGTGRP